jgi:hypothetical protein
MTRESIKLEFTTQVLNPEYFLSKRILLFSRPLSGKFGPGTRMYVKAIIATLHASRTGLRGQFKSKPAFRAGEWGLLWGYR